MTLKKDQRCPGCSGRVILRIGAMQQADVFLQVPLRVAFHGPLDSRGVGSFETLICKGCGFTEWYAHGFRHLEASPDEGIELIDATAHADDASHPDIDERSGLGT